MLPISQRLFIIELDYFFNDFSKDKEEFWWVLLGDEKNNKLLAIKRVSLGVKAKVELKFLAPNPGDYDLTLYCICDSYVRCDQVDSLKISVGGEMNEEQKTNGDL